MNNALMFSKASDEWATPQVFFDALHAEFEFGLDVAASVENRKTAVYFGPDHDDESCQDALVQPWTIAADGHTCWMNPPYSQCRAFIEKAAREASQGATVVALVPSRTDTKWWHSAVYDAALRAFRPGVEVRFVKGRLKFGEGKNSAPFPSVVIVFRPPPI